MGQRSEEVQEERDVQPSAGLVSVEEEGPSKGTVFVSVAVLGLLAGAISIPALWVLIILLSPKQSSDLVTRIALYLAAMIDAVFCVCLFRWSRLFVVSFALAAIVSVVYCVYISFLANAVPE